MSARLAVDAAAAALDIAITATGWSLDTIADLAAWLSDVAGDLSETCRWYATASRAVP